MSAYEPDADTMSAFSGYAQADRARPNYFIKVSRFRIAFHTHQTRKKTSKSKLTIYTILEYKEGIAILRYPLLKVI